MEIRVERSYDSWQEICKILEPYFNSAAEEANLGDPIGYNYEMGLQLSKANVLYVYYIIDATNGVIIGYCLVLPSKGDASPVEFANVLSLFVIGRYRGSTIIPIMKKLKRAVSNDMPQAQYLRFGVPTKERKFGQPCWLLCRMPLKRKVK